MSSAARRLAQILRTRQQKVVFAESCTAGLASAVLAAVPGISEFHCGGMVVYRNETKQQYLGITSRLLATHGAVSERIAREMATRVLERTDEAHYSAAVTGHLGPNAPAGQDGLVFIAVAHRDKRIHCQVERFLCEPGDPRTTRQRKVAQAVLERLAAAITG